MAGKRSNISSEELTSALDEAKRRIARRAEREARLAAHEERVGPLRDAVKVAISKIRTAFPRTDDEERSPLEQQVSKALVTVWLACKPPPERDDANDAHASGRAPVPASGPLTLPELETLRQLMRGAGHETVTVTVTKQLRALCDAARATGTVDESALAECDPGIAEALAQLRADRAEQEAWRVAPAHRAQPGETREVVAARVLVERGHTRFAATRAVLGQRSTRVEDSALRKAVDRAVKQQRKREAPIKIAKLSPEERARLIRLMSERQPRQRGDGRGGER